MTGDFQARAAAVRASRFVHEEQAFYAFTLDGRLYSLSADAFEALYAPLPPKVVFKAAPPAAAPPPKRQARTSSTGKAPGPPRKLPAKVAEAETSASENGGVASAVLQAVAEEARTTGELTDRICWLLGRDMKDAKTRVTVQAAIAYHKNAGKIEKVDDPKTQLPQWRLVAGK